MLNVRRIIRRLFALLAIAGISALFANPASAHCDSLDGPVVQAAKAALEGGDVNLVLIWVRKADEAEIRRAFDQTVNVRKLSPQAKALADTYFFETLVRIHRAGEGASYTGLKPAGLDIGPAIPAADQALKSGDVTQLADLLSGEMRKGLAERYREVVAAKNFKPSDVEAGRKYVERYVMFIHYVEGIYDASTRPVKGHYPEGVGDAHQKE